MKELILNPEQIVVPKEYELANLEILKIYYHVFANGGGKSLPPVIVTHNNLISENKRNKKLEERLKMLNRSKKRKSENIFITDYNNYDKHITDVNKAFDIFNNLIQISPYYLHDGNHKSIAATLTHNPIYALELETSKDLVELKKMFNQGKILNFQCPFTEYTSIKKLADSFERHCLGNENMLGIEEIDRIMNVKQRVDKLTSNGHLPKYMKEAYLK